MTAEASPAHLREVAAAWRDEDPDPATRAELEALLEADDLDGLRARFGARLQFGTAGLRGPLGAGPNRMNRALVRRATAGLAAWLKEGSRSGPVVVGRDARHGSAEFAHDAAAVLAGSGFRVLVLPRPLPTPVLAFATLHLGAAAGIMITASHNPAGDNGYKLFLGDGMQIVPPVDDEISLAIDAVGALGTVELSDRGVEVLDEAVIEAYVTGAAALLDDGPRALTAVYTALHGVGTETFRAAFARAGFPAAHEVVEQVEPDPDFPTVDFPNPEEPGALGLSLALARKVDADIVIANDPDADRLAVAIPDPSSKGGWRAFTGDEMGALLADHLLRRGTHDAHDTLVTTVVSSRLLSKLAAAAGVGYAETLTGFKWVVRATAPDRRFLFGYEEALGYCAGTLVRDKDGVSSALLVAELVAALRAEGRTLLDRLAEIFHAHGAHVTRQRSIRLGGADWLRRVSTAMAALRSAPPSELAGRRLLEVEDLLDSGRLPRSDALIWTLEGARLVLRPSGTEPKLKCYAESVALVGEDAGVQAARIEAAQVVDEVLRASGEILAGHGIYPASGASAVPEAAPKSRSPASPRPGTM